VNYNGSVNNWFPGVAQIMQRYSQFFHNSVPLSAISPTGVAVGTIAGIYAESTSFSEPFTYVDPVVGPPAVPGYFKPSGVLHSTAALYAHSDRHLEEVTEQLAMLTQVNITLTQGNTNPPFPFPLEAEVRTGPLWSLPYVRETNRIDIARGWPSNITTYYHSDTRMSR
jgi:hypothetical protein